MISLLCLCHPILESENLWLLLDLTIRIMLTERVLRFRIICFLFFFFSYCGARTLRRKAMEPHWKTGTCEYNFPKKIGLTSKPFSCCFGSVLKIFFRIMDIRIKLGDFY